MKDVWVASAAFVFGWLMSKTWDDPACRLGLALFLVLAAAMVLTFAFAVVGHRRQNGSPGEDENDEGE
jgi:hypothetical protein